MQSAEDEKEKERKKKEEVGRSEREGR